MNYGTSSYGATAIGGSVASQWFIFFPLAIRATGTYEAELEFLGSDPLFSVFLQKANELIPTQVEVFTRNDPDETPQSQGTFDGQYSQFVIGTARFIKAIVTLGFSNGFEVRGRVGD